MKVKLDNIERIDRVRASDNKPFTSVNITVNGKRMSGIEDELNSHWVIGDTVNIETYQKGNFTNFTALPVDLKEQFNGDKLDLIIEQQKTLINLFESHRMYIQKDSDYPLPTLNEAKVMVKDIPAKEMKKGDIDPRFDTQIVADKVEEESHVCTDEPPF